MYLPSPAFRDTVIAFDPIMAPLLALQDKKLKETLICFIALGDESLRDKAKGIFGAYLCGYPFYADEVIRQRREGWRYKTSSKKFNGKQEARRLEFRSEGNSVAERLEEGNRDRPQEQERRDAERLDSSTVSARAGLTPSEMEAFVLFSEGFNQTQIGQRLGFSQPTAHNRLKEAGEKIRRLKRGNKVASSP
jgi:DNA-binding CsgD family transcriptional regulator